MGNATSHCGPFCFPNNNNESKALQSSSATVFEKLVEEEVKNTTFNPDSQVFKKVKQTAIIMTKSGTKNPDQIEKAAKDTALRHGMSPRIALKVANAATVAAIEENAKRLAIRNAARKRAQLLLSHNEERKHTPL
eukprot:g450.t1